MAALPAMTVAELITHLQRLPANLPVYLLDYEQPVPEIPMLVDDVPAAVSPWKKHELPERVVIGKNSL